MNQIPGVNAPFLSPEPNKYSYQQKIAAVTHQTATSLEKTTRATVAAVAPVSKVSAQNPTANTFQAIQDIALMHLAMNANPPNLTAALQYANDIFAMTNQDSPPVLTYILQNILYPIENSFSFDPTWTTVTGIDTATLNKLWAPPSSSSKTTALATDPTPPPGLDYIAWQWLANPANYNNYFPSEKSPMIWGAFGILIADSQTDKDFATWYNFDTQFWPITPKIDPGYPQDLTVGSSFPYFLTVGLYQEYVVNSTSKDPWGDFKTQLDSIYALLQTAYPPNTPPSALPNYTAMVNEFGAMVKTFDGGSTTMPPADWPTEISSLLVDPQGNFNPYKFFCYEDNLMENGLK